MSADRELLELAAKAAGLRIRNEITNADDILISFHVKGDGAPSGRGWNPLADDGDALRLAVKLRIDVEHMAMEVLAAKGPKLCVMEPNDEPYSATRRAIVRAAAVIGKATP